MKDQPFSKRISLGERSAPKYSTPTNTYQHYYDYNSIKKIQQYSPRREIANQGDFYVQPTNTSKRSNNKLKSDLQTLKLQVQNIMQKKQQNIRGQISDKSIQKKMSYQSDDDDKASVTSEKIIQQPLRRLQQKRQMYDNNRYMQLQNNLLKTQLRNLKNKYNNKKQQMNQKCQALEKKIQYLEDKLEESQQNLSNQVESLKDIIKQLSQNSIQHHSPKTPERDRQSSFEDSSIIKNKMTQLYSELTTKNNLIGNLQDKISNLNKQLAKTTRQIGYKDENIRSVNRELQDLRVLYLKVAKQLNESSQKIKQLQQKSNKYSQQFFLQKLKMQTLQIQSQFEQQLKYLQNQLQQTIKQRNNFKQQKLLNDTEISFIKDQLNGKQQRIRNLTFQLQNCQQNMEGMEIHYRSLLQNAQRKNQQLMNNINMNYNVIQNNQQQRQLSPQNFIQKQRQVRRWKVQYRNLKQKFQNYIRDHQLKNRQNKQTQKNVKQYKALADLAGNKVLHLQQLIQTTLAKLSQKQVQVKKLHVQLQNTKYKLNNLLNKNQIYEKQTKQKIKRLQQICHEQNIRAEKQNQYRKQLEQKIFALPVADSSLKQGLQRMKKRLNEQQQKNSKFIKQSKTKQALNLKIKQQLRDLMNNMQQRIISQRQTEIQKIKKEYLTSALQSQQISEQLVKNQLKLSEQSNNILSKQVNQLTQKINLLNKQIITCKQQLGLLSHSYNLRNQQFSFVTEQYEIQLFNLRQQLEQMQAVNYNTSNVLKNQIARRDQQIAILRSQVISAAMKQRQIRQYRSIGNNFDQILKSHIEDAKHLREELNKKTQQVFKTRDNFSQLRSQHQNLKSQFDLLNLRVLADKKNLQVGYQVQLQNLRNQNNALIKSINALQQRVGVLIEEGKKKESFIQNYIVGKKLNQSQKQIVVQFMKGYQLTLGAKDIINRLNIQNQRVQQFQRFNKNLQIEVARLKQILATYQSGQADVSIFESKVSNFYLQNANQKPINQCQLFQINQVRKGSPESLIKFSPDRQQNKTQCHEFLFDVPYIPQNNSSNSASLQAFNSIGSQDYMMSSITSVQHQFINSQ